MGGMPSNKKPRKKYRPKYAQGQIPVTIRHNDEDDYYLRVIPHQELESLRNGQADEVSINTLTVRLNWAYVMAGEVFDNPEALVITEKGLAAIRAVIERFKRVGKCGATGQEFHDIGESLSLADEMQKSATRREQLESLRIVMAVNDRKRKEINENSNMA